VTIPTCAPVLSAWPRFSRDRGGASLRGEFPGAARGHGCASRLLGVACFPLPHLGNLGVLLVTGVLGQMPAHRYTLPDGTERALQKMLEGLRHVREEIAQRTRMARMAAKAGEAPSWSSTSTL
jgi:hypothetical protein